MCRVEHRHSDTFQGEIRAAQKRDTMHRKTVGLYLYCGIYSDNNILVSFASENEITIQNSKKNKHNKYIHKQYINYFYGSFGKNR